MTGAPSVVVLLLATFAASAQTYKPAGEFKLPGTSARSIAVDSVTRRLYVTSDEGVTVLNADSGEKIGTVVFKGAQDILLVPQMNGEEKVASTIGYVSADGRVARFSLTDMKVNATARLASSGAASMCYDEDAKSVEASSAGGGLTSISAESGKVEKSTKLTTGSGQIACGITGHVYVADPAANVVHVFDHETGKNVGDWPIMTGSKPSGMSLDTKGRRLFVSCEDGTIEVIDTDSGFTFIELKGGSGPSRSLFAWTPQGKGQWKAGSFTASSDGTLTGVRMNAYINYTVGGTYKFTPGLNGIAYDEKTHHLYMTAMDAGAPVVIVAGY